jgi:hypothetical protein
MAIPYLLGHDIFKAVGEVTEITDPYSTNQKYPCLFLSKHVLLVNTHTRVEGDFDATAAGTAVDKSDCQFDFLHSNSCWSVVPILDFLKPFPSGTYLGTEKCSISPGYQSPTCLMEVECLKWYLVHLVAFRVETLKAPISGPYPANQNF